MAFCTGGLQEFGHITRCADQTQTRRRPQTQRAVCGRRSPLERCGCVAVAPIAHCVHQLEFTCREWRLAAHRSGGGMLSRQRARPRPTGSDMLAWLRGDGSAAVASISAGRAINNALIRGHGLRASRGPVSRSAACAPDLAQISLRSRSDLGGAHLTQRAGSVGGACSRRATREAREALARRRLLDGDAPKAPGTPPRAE